MNNEPSARRLHWLLVFVCFVNVMGINVPAFTAEDTPRPPNVIFVLTDDLGYSDVSCYGTTTTRTPHIDQLATSGLRFTHFHTAASICSPSRAAFLTGAYPQRSGLYMGINPIRDPHWFLGLHPDEITLAEQFKRRSYATFMVGKWHLGTEPEFHPMKQGFDEYYGMPCNFSHSPEFFDGLDIVFKKTPLERMTELYTDRVNQIIRQGAESKVPFFLYLAHNYPHTPYKAGKRFAGTSPDGVRGDVIQELDWGIGEMMKTLHKAGIADNTVVIFTSDNGPTANRYAKPYRGTKYVTFEGGHRVPMIVHWPERIQQPGVVTVPATAMDLFPTLSEIIDLPLPDDRTYDGESWLPLLDGDSMKRETDHPFCYYNCENLQAVRVGPWKLHLPRQSEQRPFWDKNKAFTRIKHPVLYNLDSDVGELNDVAGTNPDIVRRLSGIADAARLELGEYKQRGDGQRPTGTLFPSAPVVSTERDWQRVDPGVKKEIQRERNSRYPNRKSKSELKKASR